MFDKFSFVNESAMPSTQGDGTTVQRESGAGGRKNSFDNTLDIPLIEEVQGGSQEDDKK